MSSVILGMGNGKALFGNAVVSDNDLIRFVEPTEAAINAFDLSVLRGDGIFEATMVWGGFPISLENHLKRLAHSAKLMDMPAPNIAAFTRAVNLVIEAYPDHESGQTMRIIVSRGLDSSTGIGMDAPATPTVFIFLDGKAPLHNLTPLSMMSVTRGYPSDIASRAPWLLNGAKTLSYAMNCAIHRECARRGIGDAVMITEDDYTLECPNATIIAQYDDLFVTPDPRIGILHGTSQRELFAWALQEGKRVAYEKLPVEELREADRLYMAHGGWVIPVKELDGEQYEVDAAQAQDINDAIHSGRTHDDALSIAPTGDYEF
ncbi:4-amino-4-deoxychorismate lyase [Bifidobacterium goeldii]|uniref:4-amino-4-deoxychorismate lyase n=1 Tax=Bifidobacterium goeldii TaxID=2306975 RepID=A0A430FDZ2_9BIFI|nr:aminodeoxychorismate lyase [Bifidobacterium goeldii]RSX51037.1 4-amino-4-deoxychorismate lyase [Bifidobacterium goeldii]